LEILQIYLLNCSTAKYQAKYDFFEKGRSCRLSSMTAYRSFSIKM